MRTLVWFMTLGVLVLLREALQLEPVARRVPLVVAVPLAGLLLFQGVMALRSTQQGQRDAHATSALLWAAAVPLALWSLGVLVGAPLFVLLFLRFNGKESWRFAMISAAATAAVLLVLFERMLEGAIPTGVLRSLL